MHQGEFTWGGFNPHDPNRKCFTQWFLSSKAMFCIYCQITLVLFTKRFTSFCIHWSLSMKKSSLICNTDSWSVMRLQLSDRLSGGEQSGCSCFWCQECLWTWCSCQRLGVLHNIPVFCLLDLPYLPVSPSPLSLFFLPRVSTASH